ncbi:MAG TPA: VWA domain-containing protein, partial [Vicinamibacterales bacterium]|nr:VWA domain-containing protein [Vicinamibacterales bacterium]
EFRDVLDEANRSNASFYPIDPRGLPVFDTPLLRQDVPGIPPPMVDIVTDSKMLQTRTASLRTLAENTDGLAMVNSNDLDGGFKKIVADLSSYYLMGYYSSGKLDGKFHSITVRVKRPGVQVRARRGYLAATPQAITAASATAAASEAKNAAAAEAHAMDAVVQPLSGFTRELPIRLQAATGYTPNGPTAVWVVGEFGTGEEWKSGAETDVLLTTDASNAQTLATAHVSVPIGAKTFRVTLTPSSPLAPGGYAVRVRARGAGATMTTSETTHIAVSPSPQPTGAVFMRRGISTGNKEVPTADLRFRRNEQIRVEIPAAVEGQAAARLLDRTGKPLSVPVNASVREDADGVKWQSAQLSLAPLAPGDYVIEFEGAGGAGDVTTRMLAAFRVVP